MIDPDKNLRIPPVTDSDGMLLKVDGKNVAWTDTLGDKVKITPDGGIAVLLTNRTGSASVKGNVVCSSGSYNNAVNLIAVNIPDPIGVFYESGIANAAEAWVVIAGIADVYFAGNTTRGQIARGYVTADGGTPAAGVAMAENVPSSPFASDKHFYEIGHILESRTGAGLAKTLIHFN